MAVVQIMTGHVHRDAVELDVRTLCDGLVESVLCQGRVGMCNYAARGVTGDVADLRIDLDVAAFGPCVHMEATVAAVVRDLRIPQVIIVNQVVDLIDIEGVAVSAVQGLVHHVRYDHRAMNVFNPVEINDWAAKASDLEVEIDIDVNIDLGVDGVLDLVFDLVVDTVIDLVIELVVDLVVDIVRIAVLVVVVAV